MEGEEWTGQRGMGGPCRRWALPHQRGAASRRMEFKFPQQMRLGVQSMGAPGSLLNPPQVSALACHEASLYPQPDVSTCLGLLILVRNVTHCTHRTQARCCGGERRDTHAGALAIGARVAPRPYLPAQVAEADVQLVFLACLPLVAAAVFCIGGRQGCGRGRGNTHTY